MSPEDVQAAYDRGVRDGAIDELDKGVARAHDRLDKHDVRMTALEKVMYAGMGAVILMEVLPSVSLWFAK